jgi:hypothetical protein
VLNQSKDNQLDNKGAAICTPASRDLLAALGALHAASHICIHVTRTTPIYIWGARTLNWVESAAHWKPRTPFHSRVRGTLKTKYLGVGCQPTSTRWRTAGSLRWFAGRWRRGEANAPALPRAACRSLREPRSGLVRSRFPRFNRGASPRKRVACFKTPRIEFWEIGYGVYRCAARV